MKTTITTALLLLSLSAGIAFAQSPYTRPYGNQPPQYGGPGYDRDQLRDDLKIERIDAIVGLSHRQERQLHRIEDQYDQVMARSRFSPDGLRQLQLRKRQDMLAVLTPAQRDRLFSAQANSRFRPGPVPYGRRG